jgi:hypothetical protein
MRQRVDEEPRRGGSAPLGPGEVGVDATQIPMLLQQSQGWLQVGGLAEATAGGLGGVPAAELAAVGAADPIQQPASVIDAGVGPHEIEHGPGVVGQVVG